MNASTIPDIARRNAKKPGHALLSTVLLSLALGFLTLTLASPSPAQEESATASTPRVVRAVTREVPPFAFLNEGQRWEGISVDLWNRIAADLELEVEWSTATVPEQIAGLEDGSFDVAVGALSMTEEREQRIDFSHAFYSSGLGIAVGSASRPSLLQQARVLISGTFLKALLGLTVLLLIVGALIWIAERRGNPDQFGGGPLRGLGSGLWWAAVTMTTVGYGDKAPSSPAGRAIGLVWMFASLLLLGGYVAAFASALTAGQMQAGIAGVADLAGVRSGVVEGTVSEQWARRRGLRWRGYQDVQASLDGLSRGEVKAVVYDLPLLQYAVRQHDDEGLATLEVPVTREPYGFGLPEGSALRDPANRVLLRLLVTGEVDAIVESHLGN
ncbi:MAG: ABC transporter substrate-binding protein [Acidobacteria bacterium]|nr:MAG: ABC transporter substrate-binding protein [Acidobacteriota bacterium]REK06342.1 MAG: ABC transporter substrate-binding protein [Acidobacteriota bacterium]